MRLSVEVVAQNEITYILGMKLFSRDASPRGASRPISS